ncbi:hypothetical protein [Floridanema evergladense]|uniref:XRE family transcriptional regulator n=1 Tax=Floridaenema evergladense BLCC-F167 TaxID=3153639 RepID=A0ABV4WD89_9CYAN
MTENQAKLEQFKNSWGLTYAQLAAVLDYSEQGVRQWFFTDRSKRKRTPPGVVIVAVTSLDELWRLRGKPNFF